MRIYFYFVHRDGHRELAWGNPVRPDQNLIKAIFWVAGQDGAAVEIVNR